MVQLRMGSLELQVDDKGAVASLTDVESGKYYNAAAAKSSLLRIAVNGMSEEPDACHYDENSGIITLGFGNSGTQVEVAVTDKKSYMTLEVIRIVGADPDVLLWGPYATSIQGEIGESVGVVHDGDYAIGIQVLNEKTIGGCPIDYLTEFADYPYPDAKMAFDVSAAWPIAGGSLLQAYARNRLKEGKRTVWGIPEISVSPLSGSDAELVGTGIALFGCSVERVLETIEAIELGEGLPHPTIGGIWGKTSPAANQSYLITDFSESTMKDAVAYTKQAGLGYVYHPEPFANWGHFELKPSLFPHGDEGMKICVDEAEREGVAVGLHTLTNFTTLNDPYVTPVPDPRLQKVGTSILTASVDEAATEIEVKDPEPFIVNLYRRTIAIDGELIEYDAVSGSAPWVLLGCRRGANGTAASSHDSGSEVGRLWDHPYDVFFPNMELQDEYSDRLAELFRRTGLKQISYDGLEGVYAAGHEDYAINRFVKRIYDGWEHEVINDASIVVTNYLWHVHTRFNWGEPWGAATREGQLEWRLHNQRYFARNFIPPMLGWFLIRSASDKFQATAPDEIEWVLSKAAGFGAGFALVADMPVLKRNGNIDELFTLVREWETARRMQAFTAEQRERLQDPKGDWHLEPTGEDGWNLYPVDISNVLECNPEELQPGQPGGADWAFYNRYAEQPLRFCMQVRPSYGNEKGLVKRPTFYAYGSYMAFETDVCADQYLVCDGDNLGKIYDKNWNLIKTVQASAEPLIVKSGGQSLSFSCKFEGDPKPSVAVKLFTRGAPELVGSR
ncbi:hypothetical protein [Paenibacillus mendelii]|uniref:Uncharacterized protein n=1 Tax=Paenibacillus mendelii TaxID=206163 RepID=A0ABV6JKG8_9BACL|nr:hypothetical protein [Paenibacillus mendelii]MCQ6563075.1 hypothetical protein [Paenibacillus mendelii]